MSNYLDTGKSLVVFGLKHASTNMVEIFNDIHGTNSWEAREKFEQINPESLGNSSYFKKHKEWFNRKIHKNKQLPIFIFIRDPKKAAFSAWIEDLNLWLYHNSHKALIEIPELRKIFEEKEIEHYHEASPNFPFSIKKDHKDLDDKELRSLVLALDKKIYPFFSGHLQTHHLINVVRLLKMMTFGRYRLNTNHLFILDLDDYDPKANELLVEYKVFDKNVIKDPYLHVKDFSTKSIVKRLKPLYKKLLKENFDMNYRITGEGMCYDHIKEHYKQYFYTPNRFKNFIQESKMKS